MYAQVGDLCFTLDGIAKKGLLVRHLVMPGLEAEGARIMQFLAEEVSRDCFINIMGMPSLPSGLLLAGTMILTNDACTVLVHIEQYHPDAHVGKPKRRTGASKETEGNESTSHSKDDVRYAEINRAVSTDEIGTVRRAAEAAGLWRFCDPPGHDGFSI